MHWIVASAALALGLAAGSWAPPALAQETVQTIWSCKDKDGRTSVTNLKEDTVGKDCRIVQQTRVNVVPAQKAGAKPAAGFPRENAAARAAAKTKQRDILEKELAAEQELLSKAKKDLAEQETIRSGDERNYARVLERLQKYKDNVQVHEKNVEALKRELANLSR
jgi:hypothetical protein